MKIDDNFTIYNETMMNIDKHVLDNSVDAIVTDPPYGLTSITKNAKSSKGFFSTEWDGSGIELNVEAWKKCYNALKPGGYLLAFGGSRTFHRIACAIEDAGFEIRDTIMWLYGTGMPHGNRIDTIIEEKYGEKGMYEDCTYALKPAYEPIIMARKPVEGTIADNVYKYGTGVMNIKECRSENGNYATNVIFDGSLEACKGLKKGELRYFYSAKTSKKDKEDGLDDFEIKEIMSNDKVKINVANRKMGAYQKPRKNSHPTVKPTALMQYLIRLITPNGGGYT